MTTKIIDDGGPAYPHAFVLDEGDQLGLDGPIAKIPMHFMSGGMSLRDWFAGQAACGLLAGDPNSYFTMKQVAERSLELADAMLAARKGDA